MSTDCIVSEVEVSLLKVSRRLFKELRKENVAACMIKLCCHVFVFSFGFEFFLKLRVGQRL